MNAGGAIFLVLCGVIWFLPVIIQARSDPTLGRRYSETGCLYTVSIILLVVLWQVFGRGSLTGGTLLLLLGASLAIHYGVFFTLSDGFREWVKARFRRRR